jgi:hypothetical protein
MSTNKYIVCFLLALMIMGASCKKDFLDKKPDDKMTEEQVFIDYTKVNKLVAVLYGDMHNVARGYAYLQHFSLSSCTDECEGSGVQSAQSTNFNIGNINPASIGTNATGDQYKWDWLYRSIRKANIILEGVRKYKTPDNPLSAGDLNIRLGETYFFRAYFHFLCVRLYGEIVYMDHAGEIGDDLNYKRESFHVIAEKICKDMDSAINLLPANQPNADFFRAEKGAALAVKAIVRWMQATPLYNGGTFPGGDQRIGKDYGFQASRWQAARDAAKAVLDLKGSNGGPRYSLYAKHTTGDFVSGSNNKVYTRLREMYHDIDAFKNEAIFINSVDKNQAWQGDNYPPSASGQARNTPVQEQVDEYEYVAPDGYGYPIYGTNAATDGYDDKNPYEGIKRDPRFYRDVMYHGSTFRNGVINIAEGIDKLGAVVNKNTFTGYYHRKFYREEYFSGSPTFNMSFPLIRLPEIMLIYAEALNETNGAAGDIINILNSIRARSFMVPVPPAISGDKAKMNDYIQRERRVELFYENNRYWVTRLYLDPNNPTEIAKENAYKAAGATNDERAQKCPLPYPRTQRLINGMRPVEDAVNGKIVIGTKKYRMERYWKEDRVFLPQFYFFPIQAEEVARCPSLGQNPGY